MQGGAVPFGNALMVEQGMLSPSGMRLALELGVRVGAAEGSKAEVWCYEANYL